MVRKNYRLEGFDWLEYVRLIGGGKIGFANEMDAFSGIVNFKVCGTEQQDKTMTKYL